MRTAAGSVERPALNRRMMLAGAIFMDYQYLVAGAATMALLANQTRPLEHPLALQSALAMAA